MYRTGGVTVARQTSPPGLSRCSATSWHRRKDRGRNLPADLTGRLFCHLVGLRKEPLTDPTLPGWPEPRMGAERGNRGGRRERGERALISPRLAGLSSTPGGPSSLAPGAWNSKVLL
ncbi:hypothetical protein DPEC_G00064040 [Dallia pectoralis]|uniref:Uncharacterized protein n=1 Tax=Dallia pectoralis TaxID=75939 RepID=A0ACC2H7Q7_DALPE|nr:hypothetical protein DPEC_G00064040 [Dallia pectoralis]